MANNITVNFTSVTVAVDPMGVGLGASEFSGVPLLANTTFYNAVVALAPGCYRVSVAWYGGAPNMGAGGSARGGGQGATAMINKVKSTGAIPMISYNGDTSDNGGLSTGTAAALVHYFNDNGGQNGGPVKYWSIGNEPEVSGPTPDYAGISAAMMGADSTIIVGAPAAAFWDTSLINTVTGNANIKSISWHEYDGANTDGTGFPADSNYAPHCVTAQGFGKMFGIEECNWDPTGGTTPNDWRNVCFIADVAGTMLAHGGHLMVYSDNDSTLGLITPTGTPKAGYYGLGIWTGMNGQFKRYSANMVATTSTFPTSTLTAFASDNGKLVVVNKTATAQALTIGVTLAAGATSGTYNIWASSAAGSGGPITEVVTAAAFSGSTISYTIPGSVAVSIDITATGGQTAVTLLQTFEEGSNGTTITAANSGGASNAFDGTRLDAGAVTLTNRPVQPCTFAYAGATAGATAYEVPGALAVVSGENLQTQVWKDMSAAGGTVLGYLDTFSWNQNGPYHQMLYNASSAGPAVPVWPPGYTSISPQQVADFRTAADGGGIEQSKLAAVLNQMISDNPHIGGFFADDVGTESFYPGFNWSTFPDQAKWRNGAIAIVQTFRSVCDAHGLIFMVNGTWEAGASGAGGGGYPNINLHGCSLADGGCVEHHDGQSSFFGPYAASAQWASASAVTNGTSFMLNIANTQAGLTEYNNTGDYAFNALQPDYTVIPAPWGSFHPTGLPHNTSGVSGTGSSTAIFDSSTVAHGALCGTVVSPGPAGTLANLFWTTSLNGAKTDFYGRMYMNLGAGYPPYTNKMAAFSNGGVVAGGVAVDTAGHVCAQDASGTLTTSSSVVPLNTWVRVEWHVVCGTTGTLTIRYYSAKDSTTITETVTGTGPFGTGTPVAVGKVAFGWNS